MSPLPTPARASIGLAAIAISSVRESPRKLVEVPVIAVGTVLQLSLRAQQRYAELVARGDEVIDHLRGVPEEPPSWATFDESPAEPGSVGDSRAATDTAAATDLADALEEEALAELLEAEALAALEEAEAETLAEAIDTADLAAEPLAAQPSAEPPVGKPTAKKAGAKASPAPHNSQAVIAEKASEAPTEPSDPSRVDDAAAAGADVDPPGV
jgi:hypothetical protein